MIKSETPQETIEKINSVLKEPFLVNGFLLKRKFFYESENKTTGNIDQYEISLSKPKGYFSLHLILNVLNKKIMDGFNQVLKKTLLDDEYMYPNNWVKKNIDDGIKSATSEMKLMSLTDWKQLKEDKESLEQFNFRFSIWLCVFDTIEEISAWKNQLILSVDLSQKWFEKVHDINYIIKSTDLKALYFLNQQEDFKRLNKKYKEILTYQEKNNINTNKLKLFYKHLINS